VLDGEHAPNDISTFIPQLMALKGSASAPVVRVPTNEPVIIKRLLDIGFYNFLIPFVETEEQAALAVASTRYPPEGIRGVSVSHRANMFGTVPDYFAQSNNNITILVQIESQQGLITSTRLPPQTAWTVSSSAQAIWLPPLAIWAMPATLTCSARSSTSLPRESTANRAAFWRRLRLMPAAIWSGATFVAVGSDLGYSARPRRNC
jgi:2-dehydro-3-deoxyglucarate aldolase